MNRIYALIMASMLPMSLWAMQADGKYNIVFCFADDWGRYASIYADFEKRPSINQVLKTPHIDRIAKEGVLFRNAFVPAPSCTPCRSSILTGQYFFNTGRGAILEGAVWDESIQSYPMLLLAEGYHIGKTYKVWGPGIPADAPYGGQRHAYESAGSDFRIKVDQRIMERMKQGMSIDDSKKSILDEVGKNFDAFIADRKSNQPFCYWFGPSVTHRPFVKGSGKVLWGLDPDSVRGKLPSFIPDVPEIREDYTDYMGMILAWDASVGVIYDRLKAMGELDNTILVIAGDHGMPGVPGGKCNLYDNGTAVSLIVRGPGIKPDRILEDFVNLMDLAPTFLEVGGILPPKIMAGRSLLNVLRSEKNGLVDSSRNWVITGRERHVGIAREGNLPYPNRALRTKDFLYIRNFTPDRWPSGSPKFSDHADIPSISILETVTRAAFPDMDAGPTKAWLVHQFDIEDWKWHYNYAFGTRPAEELYDLRIDPDEVINCAGNSSYADHKGELSRLLHDILVDAKDPRVIASPVPFELPPYTNVDINSTGH